jgi:hypothetical protein
MLPHLLPAKDHEGKKIMASVPEWLKVSQKMEWPDRWVSNFEESLVLTVKGDARYCSQMALAMEKIVKPHEDYPLSPSACAQVVRSFLVAELCLVSSST